MPSPHIQAFRKVVDEAQARPSEDNLVRLIHGLAPFSPPGLEWGIEFGRLAGTSYIMEDGKVLAVRVSRDEFGPFMQTSVAEIPLSAVPTQAFQELRDLPKFLRRLRDHLARWLGSVPGNHPKHDLIRELVEFLDRS